MKNRGVQFLLIIFLLQIFFLPLLFFNINKASAADVTFSPQVGIPGSEFKTDSNTAVSKGTDTIAKYIRAIYQYGIGVVGILAAVVLMFGGLLWLTAGGDAGRVSEAKEWIKASLLGLVIALCSYIILLTINPDLVNFREIEVAGIKPVTFNTESTNTSNPSANNSNSSFNPNTQINLPIGNADINIDDIPPTPTPIITPLDTSQFNDFNDVVTMPPNEEVIIMEQANGDSGIGLDDVSDFKQGLYQYTINIPEGSNYNDELLSRMQEFYNEHSDQNISVNVTNVRVSADGTQCTFDAEITQNE